MEKKTVVLYPSVGVGHLAPMLELAKAFLGHGGAQVDVAIVVFEPPVYAKGFAATVARAKASNASVALHVLPPPASDGGGGGGGDDEMLRFLRATNAPLRDFLHALSASRRVQAIVLDMFCADALDVAAELGLPAYFFFPSGAAGLACFLGLPAMRASVGTSFAALGESAVVSFPGVPPLRVADLAQGLADDGEACKGIIGVAARMPEARGILINSFESLEPRAMRALRDGLCVPDGPTPPVYCVGPLVSPGGDTDHDCLRWLDAQPDRSVVFLCFGSMGAFPKKQLEKIAVGLERSGQRFLWVVRGPPGPGAADDISALLPAGFQERTEAVADLAQELRRQALRLCGCKCMELERTCIKQTTLAVNGTEKRTKSLLHYWDYLPRDANRRDELGAEPLDGRLLADLEVGLPEAKPLRRRSRLRAEWPLAGVQIRGEGATARGETVGRGAAGAGGRRPGGGAADGRRGGRRAESGDRDLARLHVAGAEERRRIGRAGKRAACHPKAVTLGALLGRCWKAMAQSQAPGLSRSPSSQTEGKQHRAAAVVFNLTPPSTEASSGMQGRGARPQGPRAAAPARPSGGSASERVERNGRRAHERIWL